MIMVKIELNEQEAQSFLAWREHQELFEKLNALGVFGVRNGSAEIHFDELGNLSSAKLHFSVFQRRVIPIIAKNTLTVSKDTLQ